MSKASVSVKFEFPNLLEKLTAALQRIQLAIASTIQTQVGLRFENEGANNGHPKWKALAMRQGMILSLSGDLRKSMSPPEADGRGGPGGFVNMQGTVSEMLTEVGSKLIYAGVHDRGATIVPVKKRALRYMNPGTGKFMFSKKSVIPARPFTDLNTQDSEELEETLANLVAHILESP